MTESGAAVAAATNVCFDVGGTTFRVARSLLDQFPNTMLTRMASEMWGKQEGVKNKVMDSGAETLDDDASIPDDSDSDGEKDKAKDNRNIEKKPLFIERNGTRFQFVLDYMRDGRVSLPYGGIVSKISLQAELEYFGFENVSLDAIQECGPTAVQSVECLMKLEQEHSSRKRKHQYHGKCMDVAYLVFQEFKSQGRNNSSGCSSFSISIVVQHNDRSLYEAAVEVADGDKEFLAEYLAYFGLKYISFIHSDPFFSAELDVV